jgi:endoglucanase
LFTSARPTPTAKPSGVFALNQRLGRGVNLGNALEAPREGEWGITLTEADFKLIADAGFNAVRVPIRWSAHAADAAPYTIDPAFFARVDWVLQQAQAHKLAVVLNMHHYDELTQDVNKHEPRFLALWQQIAAHYKGAPADVLFEVLNEPHDIGTSEWNALAAKAIRVIRASNPARAIVVGPVDWYSVRRLNDLELPADDPNLIVSFHYYSPFQFTHQGAEWVNDSAKWMGTTWMGTSSERGDVDFDFDIARDYGKTHNRPVYLGEFGAYSKADMESRARWTATIARQAEQRGMSWAYWEFRAGFGVYDGAAQRWNEALRRALLPGA